MQSFINHFINRAEYQEVGAGHDMVDSGTALRIGLKILTAVAASPPKVNHGFDDAGAVLRPIEVELILQNTQSI